jgi:predicted nucleotidyltransferase
MVAVNLEITQRAQTVVKVLARLGTVRAVYLFGSHADGLAHEWSDIDLAAFMDDIENWDMQRRARAMASVMQEVGADVEAHLFPVSSVRNPEKASFAAHVLNHGVRLWQL